MSIGNLKDTGNQGNNLPFQWKVLQALQYFIDKGLQVFIRGPIGQQTINDSVSVTLASEQANIQVIPMLIESSNATGDLTAYSSNSLLSISFASRGTTGSDVSVDGGNTYVRLFPGETLNLDANGVMNYYDPTLFYWDTTIGVDSKLLIAFNYI